MGKSALAHRAGAPTARERWVCSRKVGESDCLLAHLFDTLVTGMHDDDDPCVLGTRTMYMNAQC